MWAIVARVQRNASPDDLAACGPDEVVVAEVPRARVNALSKGKDKCRVCRFTNARFVASLDALEGTSDDTTHRGSGNHGDGDCVSISIGFDAVYEVYAEVSHPAPSTNSPLPSPARKQKHPQLVITYGQGPTLGTETNGPHTSSGVETLVIKCPHDTDMSELLTAVKAAVSHCKWTFLFRTAVRANPQALAVNNKALLLQSEKIATQVVGVWLVPGAALGGSSRYAHKGRLLCSNMRVIWLPDRVRAGRRMDSADCEGLSLPWCIVGTTDFALSAFGRVVRIGLVPGSVVHNLNLDRNEPLKDDSNIQLHMQDSDGLLKLETLLRQMATSHCPHASNTTIPGMNVLREDVEQDGVDCWDALSQVSTTGGAEVVPVQGMIRKCTDRRCELGQSFVDGRSRVLEFVIDDSGEWWTVCKLASDLHYAKLHSLLPALFAETAVGYAARRFEEIYRGTNLRAKSTAPRIHLWEFNSTDPAHCTVAGCPAAAFSRGNATQSPTEECLCRSGVGTESRYQRISPPYTQKVPSHFAEPAQTTLACRGTKQGESGWYIDGNGATRYFVSDSEGHWWRVISPATLCFSDSEGHVCSRTLILNNVTSNTKDSRGSARSLRSSATSRSVNAQRLDNSALQRSRTTHGPVRQRGLSIVTANVVEQPLAQSNSARRGDSNGLDAVFAQRCVQFSPTAPVEVVSINQTGAWEPEPATRTVLPQHAAAIDRSRLTPIRGTTLGCSGWYTDSVTGRSHFYVVQTTSRSAGGPSSSAHERWWMVVAKTDVAESDWSALLSSPTLVAVEGTRRGNRGAYRTFCLPAFRGEVRYWEPLAALEGRWTFRGALEMTAAEQWNFDRVAMAAQQQLCARCGGARPRIEESKVTGNKRRAHEKHHAHASAAHPSQVFSSELLERGPTLMAEAGSRAQGHSGNYVDAAGRRFFLAVDSKGVWRQLLSSRQREGLEEWHRFSVGVAVLGRCSDGSTINESGDSTSKMSRGTSQVASHHSKSGAGSSGNHVVFNDTTGTWLGEKEFWVEHPQTKVWKKGERVVTRGGPRNKQCAWSLCLTLGWLGVHRCYLRNVAMGFVFGLTLGGCCIGWMTDACRMENLVIEANRLKVHPDTVSAEDEAAFNEETERPPCAECLCCCFAFSAM